MAVSNERKSSVPTLQTVSRALSFLEFVSKAKEPVTIKDVASNLDIAMPTAYHLLNTLVERGYIEKHPDLSLRIGFKSAVLYDGYRRGFSSQQQMRACVERLAEASMEAAWISTVVDQSVVLTAYADSPQAVRATGLYVGLNGLEHVRSSGRAVLAFLPEPEKEAMLDRSLSAVPPSQWEGILQSLDSELEQIRRRGWALDDEDYMAGILGIAAPYFNHTGRVLGAIGIWAPVNRGRANLNDLAKTVLEAANEATDIFSATG